MGINFSDEFFMALSGECQDSRLLPPFPFQSTVLMILSFTSSVDTAKLKLHFIFVLLLKVKRSLLKQFSSALVLLVWNHLALRILTFAWFTLFCTLLPVFADFAINHQTEKVL
jgi:hypothetical protein